MTERPKLIVKAKVAKIVTPTVLAINAGSELGIEVGDNVHVYVTEDVFDPDSEVLLETLIMTRLRLRVSTVFGKVSIADVTDRVSRGSLDLLATRNFRQMTYDDPINADWIRVNRGDLVRVLRPPPTPEEPPF